MKCTTCGKSLETEDNWVEFICPSCKKVSIIRCSKCKSLINPYKCTGCGFEGP